MGARSEMQIIRVFDFWFTNEHTEFPYQKEIVNDFFEGFPEFLEDHIKDKRVRKNISKIDLLIKDRTWFFRYKNIVERASRKTRRGILDLFKKQ